MSPITPVCTGTGKNGLPVAYMLPGPPTPASPPSSPPSSSTWRSSITLAPGYRCVPSRSRPFPCVPPPGGGGHGIVWIEYIHPRYKLSALHRMDACRHGTARHFSLALSCSLAIGQLHTFCNAVTRGRLPRCPCTGRTMAGTPTGRPNSKFGTPDGHPLHPEL